MKPFSAIISIFITFSSSQLAIGQGLPPQNFKDEIVQTIFNSREKPEFTEAIKKAKTLNIHKQVILEATFLYHVDLAEYSEIIQLGDQFIAMAETFDPNISKIFTSKQDWKSVIEYSLALKALSAKDLPLFKKHIQEAFWLSPDKAAAFAPHINELHKKRAMEKIQLNLNQQIFQVDQPKPTSLAKMLENKEALILRFWSPWDQKIQENYPLTLQLAKRCHKHNVSFASILISRDADGIKDTLEVLKERGKELTSYWLADENHSPLTKQLRVTEIPTIVLISKTGKILYNGSLSSKKLSAELAKLDSQ